MTMPSVTSEKLYEAIKRIIKLPDVPVRSCCITMESQTTATVQIEFEVGLDKYGPTFEEQLFELKEID